MYHNNASDGEAKRSKVKQGLFSAAKAAAFDAVKFTARKAVENADMIVPVVAGFVDPALAAALIGMAVAGLIAYLVYRLTVKALKSYRKKKQSKVVMANMRSVIQHMPSKEKRKLSSSELEDFADETIIAEYDENKDKIIQTNFVGSAGMDNNVKTALRRNRGVMVLED